VFLVEDVKLAVAMRGYDEGVVTAEEVEAKVRLVMESDKGKELRERTAVARDMVAAALQSGGSSEAAFLDFLNSVECWTLG
jgi:hypothetical protein